MIHLSTQKQFRELQRIPFCYLCAGPITQECVTNREHVIAKSLIHASDRNFPLILPSHKRCNEEWSDGDETIGQLVSLLHSEANPSHKLAVTDHCPGSEVRYGTVSGVPLEPIIWRWVRGFHAALYRVPLVDRPGHYCILTPLPQIEIKNGRPFPVQVRPQYFKFAEVLRRNRLTNNLDYIEFYNGKARFECVWEKFDCGKSFCIFALKIYEWSKLSDEVPGPKHACIGCYLSDPTPEGASTSTSPVHEDYDSMELDPFVESSHRR